ncbi:MAG: peptidoglycan DD-metalloendopeptidase family protein [Anaerolineales bacterium]
MRLLRRGALLLALISAAGGLLARVALAQTAGPQYVVREGDTLYDIARNFGLTLDALVQANPGIEAETLSVGRSITIPGFEDVAGSLNTHALEVGESLDSLSLRLGLKRDSVVRLNGLVNPDLLYINEPTVIVDQPDSAPAVPNGATLTAGSGVGLLELAAAHGQSPWALAAANRLASPATLIPGQHVVVPGGDQPNQGLPFPLSAIKLGPLPAIQGRTISIQVDSAMPITLTGSLGDTILNFNADAPAATRQYALQGIYRLADPNLYPLSITAVDAAGQSVSVSQRLPVRAGDYPSDTPLSVDPATIDPAVTVPESAQIKDIVTPVTPARYWDGLLLMPSVGAFRSVFGALRSYNGGPYDSFHGGVDFAGGETQAITAPAPGVVVFTGPLTVRGNATLIDHGWGVYTGYWHQSQILVKVGDRVETGQVLGYQGATGRVTGPHLHWELWVGGNQVDPLQWTEVSFP